jgi:hypothetical protein
VLRVGSIDLGAVGFEMCFRHIVSFVLVIASGELGAE